MDRLHDEATIEPLGGASSFESVNAHFYNNFGLEYKTFFS